MSSAVIIFVVLNILVWFFASISSIGNYLKNVIPQPVHPSIGLIAFTLSLFVMNCAILYYLSNNPKEKTYAGRWQMKDECGVTCHKIN